jgi:SAM-dependent methyltransferase
MTDDNDVRTSKTEALIEVLRAELPTPPKTILVVGCGDGREAGILARSFDADTVGTDIGGQFAFEHVGSAPARLIAMDACDLKYPEDAFDLVFSFHALEHIARPETALSEMARVLRPGGSYLIGTPNKSRLIGYVGSACSLRKKAAWNLKDYRMRLTGRWSNAAGAHAGFTERELVRMCRDAFGEARSVTDDYYRVLYRSRAATVDAVLRMGFKAILLPCVYVAGAKTSGES